MASQEAHYTSKKTFTPLKNTPLISHSAHKFTISSLFSSASSSSLKKMNLKSATFRGLGCASAAEVSAPESLVRSSADWQTKRVGKKKPRNARKKKQAQGGNVAVVPDVWCSPGIGFVTDAASVDCLIARRNPSNAGRGRADGERNLGERATITKRSIINLERINGQDSLSTFEIRRPGLDLVQAGQNGHFRGFHRSSGGLAEIMMFQTRIMLGGSDHCDQYRDLRLDVDNMSYEELLQLGDKIGYVNTGLREEEILHCLRRMKHSILDASSASPSRFHSGMEFKCSICQEEYEATDEMGKLDCGHGFHVPCIKQWLLRKNACPVCKAAAAQC